MEHEEKKGEGTGKANVHQFVFCTSVVRRLEKFLKSSCKHLYTCEIYHKMSVVIFFWETNSIFLQLSSPFHQLAFSKIYFKENVSDQFEDE